MRPICPHPLNLILSREKNACVRLCKAPNLIGCYAAQALLVRTTVSPLTPLYDNIIGLHIAIISWYDMWYVAWSDVWISCSETSCFPAPYVDFTCPWMIGISCILWTMQHVTANFNMPSSQAGDHKRAIRGEQRRNLTSSTHHIRSYRITWSYHTYIKIIALLFLTLIWHISTFLMLIPTSGRATAVCRSALACWFWLLSTEIGVLKILVCFIKKIALFIVNSV